MQGTERFSLSGKRALVTGASRGIGREIADAFAAAGAAVALASRSIDELETAAKDIEGAGGRALAIECDVTDAEAIQRCVRTAATELGTIDILVNNAGGPVFNAPFLELREAGWHKVIDLNLTSVVRVTQAVGAYMRDQRSGSVINITSPSTFRPWPAITPYGAAKAAVLNLTQALAQEWAQYGIRVNAISPGWIRTEINRAFTDNEVAAAATARDVPLGRWGEPGDVAGAAIWLASDAASYVTGAHIAIDGGLSVAVPEDWRALRVDRTWQSGPEDDLDGA
jgi:NAD(P)-dependent dehydrogenase (short-subunit alcohol dehydrogenase family)